MTLTSESTPPYLWHKPQKSAETQSFSPLLSNLHQGNNDFQYVPILNTILNSPLEVEPEAYAVFSDGTLTFYYDQNKPEGAYGMRTNLEDQWYDVADKITKVVFDKSFADYRPTSCGCWFGLCENLTTIEGMKEYLNTEKVESMERMFESCNNLTTLDVSNFNTEKVIGIWNMFFGCSSLTTLDVSNFNIEKITYLSCMFGDCSSLTTLDLSNFNTENVVNMKYMFVGCSSLQTIYVGDKWTTKNVTDSEKMFYGCNNLYGGKGTAYNSNITDATYANIDDPENGKPGYFTKSGEQPFTPAKPYVILADKTITFYSGETIPEGAIELQPSYEWNTPWLGGDYETIVFDESFKNYKPTSTATWFSILCNLKEIKGLENMNTEKITDMQYMFHYCSNIESLDLSGFDVSNVTNMDGMFLYCYNLHTIFVGDNWNLSDYLSSSNMFEDCYSLYGEQGSMPESYKVYDASMARIDGGDNAPGYFTKKGNSKATVTSIDFSVNPYSEHTLGEPINRQSGILNVNFNNREAQQLPYNHVNITPSGYDSTRVGKQTVTVNFLNASTTYEVNVTAKDTSYAYLDDNGVLTLYYGEYKQGAIFGSNNRFNNPGDVKKVVIDKSFANYHPTTCAHWFEYFNYMTEIKGLENLNTQYVTDMSRMFYGCSSLTSLDVSNFNTDNVTSMDWMFGDCYNLKTIYVGDNWTTKNVTESENMFRYSNNLYGGKGTAYNADFTDATYARIDDSENGKPGYFTKSGEPAFVPPIPYAVFSDGTLTFYYDGNKPEGAYGMRTTWEDQWYDVADKIAKVVFDKSFADYRPTSCGCWFFNCRNLTIIEGMKKYLKTDNVTNMGSMFEGCSNLTTLDVSNFKTDNVTSMDWMFSGCSNLTTLDVSNFKTDNVTNMVRMFDGCSSLQTIYVGDNWTTMNVTESGYMFNGCYSLYGGKGTAYNADFIDATYANIDDPENGKPGYFTKSGEQPYEGPIPYAVFSDGTLTFYYDQNKPEGAYGMRIWTDQWYDVADQITKVVFDKSFDNYRPTSCASWFYGCSNLTIIEGIKEYLNTENVTDMGNMFDGCNSLTTLDVSNFKTDNVTGMGYMFNGCSSLTTLDVSNFNTDNVMYMGCMFYGCSSLTSLDVFNFNTDNVMYMGSMFGGCSNLTTLDVSNFKTENVTEMGGMFYGCSSLTSLDVSNFNTENVMYMSSMFGDCDNLKTIYVGDNWTTKKVTESVYMFNGCNNLYGGKGTAYNADFTDATYARIDGGAVAPGYFTLKINNPYTKPEIKDDFYQIGNVEELLWFVFNVNNGDTKANAQLTNDIVVNKDCMERITKLLGISKAADDLTVWQPIGTLNNAYAGIFDGQGHSISGIYINNKNEENVGLFGVTSADAVIKNIGITDSYIAAKENVGAIVGNNNGIVANCYSTATIESEPNAQNVNGIAGKVSENAVVANSYYLTSEANTNDPQAKTLAEFKSGEVAQLLAEGATINGEKISGESFAGIVDLPGTENLEELTTPTSELSINSNIRIWSFENTIFVENGCNKIEIVDMAGRVVKQVTPNSDRTEISLPNSGVYIVKTGVKTQKVIVR